MWMDVDECGWMWMDVEGCGWMWTDVDGCGWMCMDVDGWMWMEMRRIDMKMFQRELQRYFKLLRPNHQRNVNP